MTDPSETILRALADAQEAGRFTRQGVAVGPQRTQWARAESVCDHLDADLRRGIGPRLSALERRGLVESVHSGSNFSLTRRYDVSWRLTDAGWDVLGVVHAA